MNLHILAVGKQKTEFYESAIAEYVKRITKPYSVTFEIVPADTSTDATVSVKHENALLLSKLKQNDYVIVLDERGTGLDTKQFAHKIEQHLHLGTKRIVFVIGGSYGLLDSVKQRAHITLRLSSLVFPHELARLVLIEQIYRATNILAGGKYHH